MSTSQKVSGKEMHLVDNVYSTLKKTQCSPMFCHVHIN